MYENETLLPFIHNEMPKKQPKSHWWCIFDVYKINRV